MMGPEKLSVVIYLRTGFFRLESYEMTVSTHGIHLSQMQKNHNSRMIELPLLEIQNVIVYTGRNPEVEIITSREVYTGVLPNQVDVDSFVERLRTHFGSRLLLHG